jgi:hypothetical protein
MGKSRFPKPDQTFSQDLTAGVLSFTTTTTNNKPFHLDQVIIKFTVAISETVTISIDSVKGSAYDTILKNDILINQSDYVYRPQGDAIFNAGDEIKVECTNDDATGTVNGIVKTSEIN